MPNFPERTRVIHILIGLLLFLLAGLDVSMAEEYSGHNISFQIPANWSVTKDAQLGNDTFVMLNNSSSFIRIDIVSYPLLPSLRNISGEYNHTLDYMLMDHLTKTQNDRTRWENLTGSFKVHPDGLYYVSFQSIGNSTLMFAWTKPEYSDRYIAIKGNFYGPQAVISLYGYYGCPVDLLNLLSSFRTKYSGMEELDNVTPNEFNSSLNYNYTEIDLHALKAPASVETSVKSLASYLAAPTKNDREKARSIFRWITGNINPRMDCYTNFINGRPCDTTPEGVLKNRKANCEGYANLFLALAKEAGLTAVKISGNAKVPGKNLSDMDTGHAWNAAKINGSWYLIDLAWNAGCFMTPPGEFIFGHFPRDQKWQLLNHSISRSDFENLPQNLTCICCSPRPKN